MGWNVQGSTTFGYLTFAWYNQEWRPGFAVEAL